MGADVLHAHVVALPPTGSRARIGVVFVDARGQVVRRIGRMVSDSSTQDLGVFRAIVYVLWNSCRLGWRRVVVHSDSPGVVAQINGGQEVPSPLVGPYLEVRALLHAYRSARVEVQETPWGREARAAAEVARTGTADDIIEDLPLWAGEPMEARSLA